jgi:hypothetical protein
MAPQPSHSTSSSFFSFFSICGIFPLLFPFLAKNAAAASSSVLFPAFAAFF